MFMISFRRFTTLLAVVSCLAMIMTSSQSASAQEAKPAAGSSYTEASLGTALESMGLEPKKLKKRYDFDFTAIVEKEEWVLSMSAVLSQDGKSVWMMAWLDELPKTATEVPRTALLRMLARNDKMGSGKFFAYIATNRRFVLQRVIPNEKLTNKDIMLVLKDLGRTVVSTYPEWSVDNWTNKDVDGETAGSAESPESTTRPATAARPTDGTTTK